MPHAATAATGLFFDARFLHNLNLYKKVYIPNVSNQKLSCQMKLMFLICHERFDLS